MQLFATAQGDLYLDQVATQVDGGRDQRKAFLDYLALESLDLTLVGEQSPVSIGVMVMDVPMCIRLYGKAYQSQRSVGDRHVAVGKTETAFTQRFHFSTDQSDTAFQIFQDLIIEVRLLILLKQLERILILFHLLIPGNPETDKVPACIRIDNSNSIG